MNNAQRFRIVCGVILMLIVVVSDLMESEANVGCLYIWKTMKKSFLPNSLIKELQKRDSHRCHINTRLNKSFLDCKYCTCAVMRGNEYTSTTSTVILHRHSKCVAMKLSNFRSNLKQKLKVFCCPVSCSQPLPNCVNQSKVLLL